MRTRRGRSRLPYNENTRGKTGRNPEEPEPRDGAAKRRRRNQRENEAAAEQEYVREQTCTINRADGVARLHQKYRQNEYDSKGACARNRPIPWRTATAAKTATLDVGMIVAMVTTTAVARVGRRRRCGRSGKSGVSLG